MQCIGIRFVRWTARDPQGAKQMNAQGGMKLIGVNETIMEVFDITGFADILTIE